MRPIAWLTAGAALIAASACNVNVNENTQAEQDATAQMSPQEQQLAQMREQARAEFRDLRFVVDKSERQVRVFNGDRLLRTEQVAIGESDHETRPDRGKSTRSTSTPNGFRRTATGRRIANGRRPETRKTRWAGHG